MRRKPPPKAAACKFSSGECGFRQDQYHLALQITDPRPKLS